VRIHQPLDGPPDGVRQHESVGHLAHCPGGDRDRAPLRLAEVRVRLAERPDDTHHEQVVRAVPVPVLCVEKGTARRSAGARDNVIESAEPLDCLRDERRQLRPVGDIRLDRQHVAGAGLAQALAGGVEMCRGLPTHRDVCTLLCQRLGTC